MGILGIIAEGGQTWTHRMRMLRQVIKFAIGSALLIGLSIFCLQMASLDKVYFQGTWYFLKSKITGVFLEKIEVDQQFWATSSREIYSRGVPIIPPKRVEKVSKPYFDHLIIESKKSFYQSGIAFTITVSSFLLFFLVKGTSSRRKKHISGRKIISPRMLAWQLTIKREASSVRIGKLPFIKGTETQHTLITGGTGSGKTNCIHHLLSQIKKEGRKGLIVDTTGIFVDRYFNPKNDILLNPFDPRSLKWNPWVECENDSDFEEIAECFIPKSFNENENYWRTAARSLFTAILRKTKNTKKIAEIQEWILTRSLSDLALFVKGTKAAAHVDMNSEKTAGSVRSVASSFLSCLEYLEETNDPFSISKWMKGGSDSWIFLLAKPSQRSALGPLLSCWISIAFRNLLQLSPCLDRRVWFVLDELPTLNKIKDLESFLAEGRKYGGCGLLAIQSPSQLDAIYGNDITKTIIGNCATKVVFSEQDPVIANLISKSFGEREILEYNESISYGANSIRDGVSLTESRKQLPLVTSSEIQSLKKNQAYIKFPGNYPVTKIRLGISS